jgi:hypothetical protein
VPSRNATVPVGVPEVVVTVAVKVTVWPAVEGFSEEATAVAVAALVGIFTVCVRIAEVLVVNVVSPPKMAVMECAPAASAEVVRVVCPATSSVPVPIVVVPSRKVTIPVGVPIELLLTVAVNVTDCPVVEGLIDEVTTVVVVVTVTVCVSGAELLLPKVASPA